jgi:hypothetical protein
VRELVELIWHRNPGDLAREPRDRLADEQAAERLRLLEWAEIEREASEKPEPAWAIEADLLLGRR